MNKSFIKFVTDIGPLVVFFLFYYNNDKNLKIAIPPLIVATIIAVLIIWILEKKIPMVPLLSGILITLFGGLTIYFDNPIFIYMKPTIINVIFAMLLIFGKIFFDKNFLKFFFKTAFQLDDTGWNKLNFRWALFFIFLAALNEIVWRTQPETIWVNFKVWGILPITFIFTALQIPVINKHKI